MKGKRLDRVAWLQEQGREMESRVDEGWKGHWEREKR